jgi:hypothetical protein
MTGATAILAGILVARHLNADDHFDNKPSPADGIDGRLCGTVGGADHAEN